MADKDSVIVYQHNYDTLGDSFEPKEFLDSYQPYEVHIMVSNALATTDDTFNQITLDILNSYDLTFDPVSAVYIEPINPVIPVIDNELKEIYTQVYNSYEIYLESIYTLDSNGRRNSNIYKNIFPEPIINMDYINQIGDSIPTTMQDIVQENHGLELYDVVYLNSSSLYEKALADESEKSFPVGIITKVTNNNVFTLMDIGIISYIYLDHQDTSILYLSDVIPGKIVHYAEISNMIYIPVGIYANNRMIINIQQGSSGDELKAYSDTDDLFDAYVQAELNEVVDYIVSLV